jgi:1-acyl-sn-glycerol-3-phosphate acyltransferase
MLIISTRFLLYYLVLLLSKLLLKVTVTGREHLPSRGPLIVIANHYSLFDPILLTFHLPYQPVFMSAADLSELWYFRVIVRLANTIPVWRGRVDREALRRAQQVVEEGEVLGIFPEGGIDPELMELTGRGQSVQHLNGQNSRVSGQLIEARPGAAYLATLSQACILPVGIVGAEKILGNLRRFRRTVVTLHIGPVFGPLTIDPNLRGSAKREQLDAYGHLMMQHIAALMPPENRGPYGGRAT